MTRGDVMAHVNWTIWTSSGPTYGNYGGQNYTNGQKGGTGYGLPGVDTLDELFKAHDKGYEVAENLPEGSAERTAAFLAADRELIDGITALQRSDEWKTMDLEDQEYADSAVEAFLLKEAAIVAGDWASRTWDNMSSFASQMIFGPPNSDSGPPGWATTYANPWASTVYYNDLYGLPNAAQTANNPFITGSTIPIPYLHHSIAVTDLLNAAQSGSPLLDINSIALPNGSLLPSNQAPPHASLPTSTVLQPSLQPPQPLQYMDQSTALTDQLNAVPPPQFAQETVQCLDHAAAEFTTVNLGHPTTEQLQTITDTFNGQNALELNGGLDTYALPAEQPGQIYFQGPQGNPVSTTVDWQNPQPVGSEPPSFDSFDSFDSF